MWAISFNDVRVNEANCGTNGEKDYGSFNYFRMGKNVHANNKLLLCFIESLAIIKELRKWIV